MEFERLPLADSSKIREMSDMATEIVREHYDPIIGRAQNDYMLDLFQSEQAIREQLEHGYEYYFVREDRKTVGFLAFYPRENALYLSKLYLYKDERGKGYARKMLAFVAAKAKEAGFLSIELNVNRKNGSVAVYEKLGFQRLRAEKNDIGAGYFMDDYVYGLRL